MSRAGTSAIAGLKTFLETRGGIAKSLSDAQAHLNELLKKGGGTKEIAEARGELAKFQAQLAAIPLTKGGAEAFGASLFAIFEQLTRDGVPALEIIKQIDAGHRESGCAVESRRTERRRGIRFISVISAALARDEIAGPIFEAVAGLGAALEGLHNSGLLTQETFGGIAEEITATYKKLVQQGRAARMRCGSSVGRFRICGSCSTISGMKSTRRRKRLIDEAEAAGVVGDAHRTAQEQMLLATQRIEEAVVGLANAFGVILPSQMEEAARVAENKAKEIQKNFDEMDPEIQVKFDIPQLKIPKPADIHVPIRYDVQDSARSPPVEPAHGISRRAVRSMPPQAGWCHGAPILSRPC